uniref:Uncharacterized protein n=1 Tax=Timema shepardi TaxID=629360 RepID=A0A7R9G0H6_TIMSH|nr:unnamed protein product [Timema shepardi]
MGNPLLTYSDVTGRIKTRDTIWRLDSFLQFLEPEDKVLPSSSPSADLVPTLLGMYDALIGRAPSEGAAAAPKQPPPRLMESVVFSRPLSVSSIASSSSSSSSGTSSCSGGGRRLGAAPKSSAYLASIESLEDDSEEEARLKCSQEVATPRQKGLTNASWRRAAKNERHCRCISGAILETALDAQNTRRFVSKKERERENP